MIRKVVLGILLVAIGLGAYWGFRRRVRPLGTAYVSDRDVILWSTTAQVRERLATLDFGERVDILGRQGEDIKVRTSTGVTGWTQQGNLLSEDSWRKIQNLNSETSKLPVEARGHTRVLANLHTEPGRDAPRIRQLTKAIPVDMYERQTLEMPTTPGAPARSAQTPSEAVSTAADETTATPPAEAKKEDWWLVRAHVPEQAPISGWLLGRFLDLDAPAPLPDYASSAGMSIVAWFELNRVTDPSGAPKPQYLAVGTHGAEGQPCDFTVLRVFTWSGPNQRYETAFGTSNVCGKLPVQISPASKPGGDAAFEFEDWSRGTRQRLSYHMHQTIVRRVREPSASRARP